MKKENDPSMMSSPKMSNTSKLSYSQPKVTFVPQKMKERLNSGSSKHGDWTVPVGCC